MKSWFTSGSTARSRAHVEHLRAERAQKRAELEALLREIAEPRVTRACAA